MNISKLLFVDLITHSVTWAYLNTLMVYQILEK